MKFKRVIKLILVLFIIFIALSSANDIGFAQSIAESRDKIKENNAALAELKNDAEDIKKNLQAETQKLESYEKQVSDLEIQINSINNEISEKEMAIEDMNTEIEALEIELIEIEEKVKSFMLASQSTMRVNGYIEFVMGANSFSDIVRRIEGMNAIQKYNDGLIDKMKAVKDELEEQRLQIEFELAQIEEKKSEIELKVKEIEILQEKVQIVVTELLKMEEEAQKAIAEINEKNAAEEAVIRRIEEEIRRQEEERKRREEEERKRLEEEAAAAGKEPPAVTPSGGFGPALPTSHRITATVWNYPAYMGGGPHMGIDYGTDRGTKLLSVGNGLVVATKTGCAEGSFACGGGYGNYISYLVNVNGHNYGIMVGHLSSVNVSRNQMISKGQVIGYTGNTGISTGPHLHLEVINMGSGSLTDAWNRWDGTVQFGTGPAALGGRRCDMGYSVPCRINPQSVIPN